VAVYPGFGLVAHLVPPSCDAMGGSFVHAQSRA
jgi:hypothetical protein